MNDGEGLSRKVTTPAERRTIMKKTNLILLCAVLVLAAVVTSSFAQEVDQVDLSGTWTGYTTLGDGSRADFNLVLEKAGESYTGKINDDAGMIPGMAIKNVIYKDRILAFEIDYSDGMGTIPIRIELKFEGEALKGSWMGPNGESNIIELGRKN
jgi:hypothetical protein